MTDAKNQTTLYEYYIDNNLKKISCSNVVVSTPTVTFAYHTNYDRLVSVVDGLGTNTYSYYAVSNGVLGAGLLQAVDGPLTNDTVTYVYDELGRVKSRAVDEVAERVTYDSLGRVTVRTNVLGSFTNYYVNNTLRVISNSCPNGQTTTFGYFGSTNDQRLQSIWHRRSDGSTISKFDYAYGSDGQITNWTQQIDSGTPKVWVNEYDAINQLLGVTVRSNGIGGAILNRYVYVYDKAANRTSEQVDFGVSAGTRNDLDQLMAVASSGGAVRFRGSLNEIGTVDVAGRSAAFDTRNSNFVGFAQTSSGTNIVPVIATDYSSNKTTNRYQLIVTNNAAARTLSYDANGNVTNVVSATGTNSFEWDAADRLTAIDIHEAGQIAKRSEFSYDGAGRRVKIVEKTNGVAQSQNFFVWCGTEICQMRDASGAGISRRYLGTGETISGTNYFYTRDHLGSAREMLDAAQQVRARYDYDPYGRRLQTAGDQEASFGYTGHFYHGVSRLHFAMFRALDSDTGRWLNRDPLQEDGGINLYGYADNNPINLLDPFGLDTCTCDRKLGGGPAKPRGLFWNTLPRPAHTFTFTTNPDGTLGHTYSWGNTANTKGWNKDQPEDIAAAKDALKKGYYWTEAGKDLDPFVEQAFNELNKKENEHINLGVARNCKTETQKLLDKAKSDQKASK